MNHQPYHGRCCICAAPEPKIRPVAGFCFVHEHYQGSGERTIRRLADAHDVAEVYADRVAQIERDAVRDAELRTHAQVIADEWSGGDHGEKLVRQVISDRQSAGLPCFVEELAVYDVLGEVL